MCGNCGSTQGPFYRAWFEKGEKLLDIGPACKNKFPNDTRISECVERRAKIDAAKYQEQLHAYA